MKHLHAVYARSLLFILTLLFLVSGLSLSAAAAARSFDSQVNRPIAEALTFIPFTVRAHT